MAASGRSTRRSPLLLGVAWFALVLACASEAGAQLRAPEPLVARGPIAPAPPSDDPPVPGSADSLGAAPAETLAVVRGDTLALPPVPESVAPPVVDDDDETDRSATAIRGHGRPNPLKAALEGMKNYVSDGLYLYTSPLRMSLGNVLIAAAVGGVGYGLYQVDDDLFRDVQRSRVDPLYDAYVIRLGGFIEPMGLIAKTHWYWSGASLAGWIFDVPLLRTIPAEVLESNTLTGLARQPIEQFVGRDRPSYGKGARSFDGGSSFPSGHASVICETAAIFSHHARHPLARMVIWGVAGVACVQRLDTGSELNHWASDVWMGAAIGTYCGHTIAVRNAERRHGIPQRKWYDVVHRPPKASWTARPVALPGGAGVALNATF